MYLRSHNFVGGIDNCAPFPRSEARGYAIPRARYSFSDLQKLAHTTPRGVGLGAGILPGSSCYDSSYDPGDIHCASFSDVLWSAVNPLSTEQTTTCSASETSCLTTTNPSSLDPCTPIIGVSCSMLALIGLGVFGLVLFMRGGR